eukprot:scaffold11900_cov53-Phaeocystis_antarctica.AAC.1
MTISRVSLNGMPRSGQAKEAGPPGDPEQAGSDLGKLAPQRPLSAPDRASGCATLRPASANQPLGRLWHPGPSGLVFDALGCRYDGP